jgi:hypothetical protein
LVGCTIIFNGWPHVGSEIAVACFLGVFIMWLGLTDTKLKAPPRWFFVTYLSLLAFVTWGLLGWNVWNYFHPRLSSDVEIATASAPLADQPPEKREIIDTTPEYLMGLFQDKWTYQGEQLFKAYFGKWMRLTETVDDVTQSNIWSYLKKPNAKPRPIVMYLGDPNQLGTVQVGKKISLLCQIAGAKINSLLLVRCEIEKQQ